MNDSAARSLPHLDQLIARHCSPEWRELLRAQNTVLTFAKGEAIFTSGQKAERMFMIHRGRVKVVASYIKGKERIIRMASDGEALGHRGIGQEPVYTASAIALAPTRVNAIPMALFLSTLKANPHFCYHFLLYFAAELRLLDQHLRDLMNMDVAQRVAKVILLCRDTFGMDEADARKLAFTLPRRDIASMADTTYESVIRTLAHFDQEGIIELEGKGIRIRNKAKLEKAMSG
ncbi:MAG: Crp/Fnr family transcriptional regulator [Flavobacteriales bacterium]|jgi:CRP-like cAMP-binding protein|nr:Crp/Fnr family transcriptional regulator [Flavobacteriales bacterium]